MFSSEDNSKENFKGTLTSFGHPICVTKTGRFAAGLPGVEPTVFHFYGSHGKYSISLGRTDEGKGFVGLEPEGFLCIKKQGIVFFVSDLEGQPLSNKQVLGEKTVHLVSSTGSADVLLFGGADLFDQDVDARHNFLIAAQKIKHVTVDESVYYFAPDGDGTWTKYLESTPYFSVATPLILNVI